MSEFQVGRNVLRAALAELQREGLIARVQGAGTFVVVRKSRYSLLHGDFMASVGDPAMQVDTTVRSRRQVRAGATVGLRLGVDENTACHLVETLTSIDGLPVMLTTSYLTDSDVCDRMVGALEAGRPRVDWYDVFNWHGRRVTHRDLVIEAVAADQLVATDLAVEVGAPLMFVQRRLFTDDGTPVEFGVAYCRGDRYSFAYRVLAGSGVEDI